MHIDHDRQVGVDDHPYCSFEFLQPIASNDLDIRGREEQRRVNTETRVVESQPANKCDAGGRGDVPIPVELEN
jgi:hypothetical protein